MTGRVSVSWRKAVSEAQGGRLGVTREGEAGQRKKWELEREESGSLIVES